MKTFVDCEPKLLRNQADELFEEIPILFLFLSTQFLSILLRKLS